MQTTETHARTLMAVFFLASIAHGGVPAPGLDTLGNVAALPFLRGPVQVHYEGSIDKKGANADWDWYLYQDERGEWVLFDVDGPGCVYNFVQHRYPTCPEPTFRFYFDGESEPRFSIKQSEFGKKAPFVSPLSAIYVGPPVTQGPIWVVRSFVPMPFRKGCKITSSVKLEGNEKVKNEGGWGHVMYHSYATAERVTTFTGNEDYSRVLSMWNRVGEDPKDNSGNVPVTGNRVLQPGETVTLFNQQGEGSIAAVKLWVTPYAREMLQDLWIRFTWEDETAPAVECPIGAFFGNELGYHDQRLLTHGMGVDGTFYSYFPMPFWRSAKVELSHRGQTGDRQVRFEIQKKTMTSQAYQRAECGHFRASPYLPATTQVRGRDSMIGRIHGRGHLVAGLISGRRETCEGDVRVHIDGISTPQVESDGSESWANYGWGFPNPPQSNPSSGYDGLPYQPWSMIRVMTGDFYPFRSGLRFTIEDGRGDKTSVIDHSGVLFYYGEPEVAMVQTDRVDMGDPASMKKHSVSGSGVVFEGELTSFYEGDDDRTPVTARGRNVNGYSQFTVAIDPENTGVRLRRMSDQKEGRQRVRVFVDGEVVTERTWYRADCNPFKRWLDDEFDIPEAYTHNKARIIVRLEWVPSGGAKGWSEYRYTVFSQLRQAASGTGNDPWGKDWYAVNAEVLRGLDHSTSPNLPANYLRKGVDAGVIYAILNDVSAGESPLVLHALVVTPQTQCTILGAEPFALQCVTANDETGWRAKDGTVTLRLPKEIHDLQRFRRPVVLRFTEGAIVSHPWVAGRFGLARRFFACAGSPCTIPFTPAMNTPEFTVEFWAKIQSVSAPQVLVARGPKDAGHWELWVRPETGTLHYFAPGFDPKQTDSGIRVNDDQWHFIAFRVKPGNVALAIDGKIVIDQSVVGRIDESSHALTLGSLHDGQFSMNGLIEGLRWSNCLRPSTPVPAAALTKDEATFYLDTSQP